MSDEKQIAPVEVKSDLNKVEAAFYILLVPDVGAITVLKFVEPQTFAKAMHKWLTARTVGHFVGNIIPFHGWLVEFTSALQSFRLNVPNIGEIVIADSAKGKYVSAQPETAIEAKSTTGAGPDATS